MPTFFDLPAELRNTIYEYAATGDKAVPAYLMFDTCKMLFVDKQMRLECLPIYFESNTFYFDPLPTVQSDHPRLLTKYCQSIEWIGEFRVDCKVVFLNNIFTTHCDLYSTGPASLFTYTVRLSLRGPPTARFLDLRMEISDPKIIDRMPGADWPCADKPNNIVISPVLEKYMLSKRGSVDWDFLALLKMARFIQRLKCFVFEETDRKWSPVLERTFSLTTG